MMFSVLFILCVLGVSSMFREVENQRKLVESDPKYFTQTLDHFDSLNTANFKQKYYEDDTYFTDKSGPVFLYISGEMPCGGIESWGVEMYAKPLNALFLTLEHRYYGDSSPFEKLKVGDLKYLSSRQALEDLSNFRTWYQETILGVNSNNKWIVIGGSYSGALSAWSRSKYPHLYVGSLASSGVVNTIYDFYEFDEQIVDSVPEKCSTSLRNATRLVESLISNPSTRNSTMDKFGAASLSDGDFLLMMADLTAVPVQYGYQEYLCFCIGGGSGSGENNDENSAPNISLLDGLVSAFHNVFLKYNLGDVKGYDVKYLLTTDNNPSRMWWYQKCSEMTYFQVAPSDTKKSIRSSKVNLQWHKERCERAFGISYSEEMAAKSIWHYGSTSVFQTSSNTLFTNGSQDPWKRATIQGTGPGEHNLEMVRSGKGYSNVYVELKCENCGHCVDLYNCPGGCKKQSMVDEVRIQILKEMMIWLE